MLIRKGRRNKIKSVELINERIIILEINIYDHSTIITGVYSIDDNASTLEKDIFFNWKKC